MKSFGIIWDHLESFKLWGVKISYTITCNTYCPFLWVLGAIWLNIYLIYVHLQEPYLCSGSRVKTYIPNETHFELFSTCLANWNSSLWFSEQKIGFLATTHSFAYSKTTQIWCIFFQAYPAETQTEFCERILWPGICVK